MFRLLRHLGFDRVMIWPMLESIPAPLCAEDAAALREFRGTIADAQEAGLECWLTTAANCVPDPRIAAKPWRERNPFPLWTYADPADRAQADPFLAHRSRLLEIVNNADAYVTIDGDPGGIKGSKPEAWMNVFRSDRAAVDRYGVDPSRKRLIPWIWCGWGTDGVWREPIESFTRAEMELIRAEMPEPWALLPGRSYRAGHANGRINIAQAEELGMIPRSTIFCYEAIEFEPTPPTAILQFDIIRQNLREESRHAGTAEGIFGNAQQPVMVLPNLYFFARAAWDLSYLDRSDDEVLADFADLLGGPRELLRLAWSCLRLGLEALPADLPARLRGATLAGEAAAHIPGGPRRYLDLLAAHAEARIALLRAIARPAQSQAQAAEGLAAGAEALVGWWKIHRYVFDGNGDEPYSWKFSHPTQVALLAGWARANTRGGAVIEVAAGILAGRSVLPGPEARARIGELINA